MPSYYAHQQVCSNRICPRGIENCKKSPFKKLKNIYKISKEPVTMKIYLPISILPSTFKVMRKIIHNRVYSFLNDNDILYQHH